jgi:hypothetical protein
MNAQLQLAVNDPATTSQPRVHFPAIAVIFSEIADRP